MTWLLNRFQQVTKPAPGLSLQELMDHKSKVEQPAQQRCEVKARCVANVHYRLVHFVELWATHIPGDLEDIAEQREQFYVKVVVVVHFLLRLILSSSVIAACKPPDVTLRAY